MNQHATECDLPKIDRFLEGDVDSSDANQLDQHLETCSSCRDYLETRAADTQTWTDIGGLLKTDRWDEEAFLLGSGPSLGHRNSSARVDEIIAAMTPSEFPSHLGRLGIYEVTGVVGSGATGVVFKAIDPSLDRTVAIKVLSPALASSGAARKRFERESKAAAAVLHPNVIPIHGVCTSGNLSYLVMAYVGGNSLQNRLATDGALETAEVLRIGSQIASGLAAAHDQGLVHRDIKPANIILEDNVERIAITDFGLARAVDDASLTREGVIAGTPRYMSPEQAAGQSVTQSTDLFSLGSVLYSMATGRPPFRAESSYVVMRKICEQQPTPVRELNPNIPAWLSGAIQKLMSKSPEDRFSSASQVAELLESSLAHVQQPTTVSLPSEIERLTRVKKSSLLSKKVIVMIATVSIALSGLAFMLSAMPGGIFPQSFSSNDEGFPDVALFQNAQVIGESDERQLRVVHDDKWYTVVKIADISSKQLFEFADEHVDKQRVNKRIIEDLPVLFQMMKKPLTIPTLVELEASDGSVISAKIIATQEKRFQLLNRNQVDSSREPAPQKKISLFEDAVAKKGTDGQELHVLLDEHWYQVTSIAGETTQGLFQFANKTFDSNFATQRIIEDLPLVFQLMRKPFPLPATVELLTAEGESLTVRLHATERKRKKLMRRRRERSKPAVEPKADSKPLLNFADLEKEVRFFEENFAARFAYLNAKNSVDLKTECKRLVARHSKGISPQDLAFELNKIVAQFIDGHARVEHRSSLTRPKQTTPFLIEPIGDRFVAFFPSRESFVNGEYPYLNKIDGVAVAKLLEPFKSMIAKGSSQYVLRQQLRLVRDLGLARQLSGISPTNSIRLELANEAGETKNLMLPGPTDYPSYRTWPRPVENRILDNNFGYLRITSMDEEARNAVAEWMPRFKDTDGLIVDVRGNGGGTREALIELAGHLLRANDSPRIANVCKYRLHSERNKDHLESRYAYRVDSSKFDERERASIQKFAKSFTPEWEPSPKDFSEWHYLVLSKDANDPRPHYSKPVVILMDQKCFSATDIFLGAFKGWSNVTLVGQPSGGGSARSEQFELPKSEIKIRCASMASFQPNGKLYDGNGIQPDVVVEAKPEYFLRGGDDPFMEKAFEVLGSLETSK